MRLSRVFVEIVRIHRGCRMMGVEGVGNVPGRVGLGRSQKNERMGVVGWIVRATIEVRVRMVEARVLEVLKVVVLLVSIDFALSQASVQQVPIHHGGLSIGQARRADWLIGGLQAHAGSIDALAEDRLGW
jgi:hypothetical protein